MSLLESRLEPLLEFQPRQLVLAELVSKLQQEIKSKNAEEERQKQQLEATRGELVCCRLVAQAAVLARQEQVVALRRHSEVLTAALVEARDFNNNRNTDSQGTSRTQLEAQLKRQRLEIQQLQQQVIRDRREIEQTRHLLHKERSERQLEVNRAASQPVEELHNAHDDDHHHHHLHSIESPTTRILNINDSTKAGPPVARLRESLMNEIEADLRVRRQLKRRCNANKPVLNGTDSSFTVERVLDVSIHSPREVEAGVSSVFPVAEQLRHTQILTPSRNATSPESSKSTTTIGQLREDLEQALRVQDVLRSQLSVAQRISSINISDTRASDGGPVTPTPKSTLNIEDQDHINDDGRVAPNKAIGTSRPPSRRAAARNANPVQQQQQVSSTTSSSAVGKRGRRGRSAGVTGESST